MTPGYRSTPCPRKKEGLQAIEALRVIGRRGRTPNYRNSSCHRKKDSELQKLSVS